MCYWIVTESGKIVLKMSVEHVTQDEIVKEGMRQRIDEFNKKVEDRLDDMNFNIEAVVFGSTYLDDTIDDMEMNPGIMTEQGVTPTEEEYDDMVIGEWPEADDEEVIEKYIGAELILDVGSGNERRGRVVKRSRGLEGEPIGHAHTIPLFDTREYDVEFTDGTMEKYAANVITENMFAQVDSEG